MGTGAGGGRLRLLGAFAGGVLIAWGLWALWHGAPEAASAPVAAPSGPVDAPPPPPAEPASALPEAIARYLASTVYPPGSGRLTRDDRDLLEPNRRYEGPRPIRDSLGEGSLGVVTYQLTAEHYDVTGLEREPVWLEVKRGDEPVDLPGVEARLVREGRAGPEGDPLPVSFEREPDGRWIAELPLEELADHHGTFVVEVRFAYQPGREHSDALRFFHTPADRVPARFTGRFLDYVRGGSLRIEVGLDVERPGFFRIDANLYDAGGEPAAFAAWKGELARGAAMVPLEVYGKVLRDALALGPYRVGELRGYRFIDGSYPDHETIAGIGPSWVTGRYALAELTDEPYQSEHQQRVVELMLQDAEAGLSLDVPELPPGEGPGPAAAAPPARPGPGTP